MANPKPIVAAGLICEHVLHEKDGILSVIRIVDIYTMMEATLPGGSAGGVPNAVQVLNLTGLVALKAGGASGDHAVTIAVRAPNGQVLALPEKYNVSFQPEKPAGGANLIFKFLMPYTSVPGLYWFDVSWDGEVLTSIPLTLKKEEQSSNSEPALEGPH